MVSKNLPHNLKIGVLGENIASRYLEERGFQIIERNYRRKWGEIDIIALRPPRQARGRKVQDKLLKNKGMTKFWSQLPKILHFVEVKTVSREIHTDSISRESKITSSDTEFRPEDNMHPRKVERLKRAIQSYLLSNDFKKFSRLPRGFAESKTFRGEMDEDDIDWQFDVVAIWVDPENKQARVKFHEDIVL